MAKLTQAPGTGFTLGDSDDPVGVVKPPATGSITVTHKQAGRFVTAILNLDNVPQAVVNGTEYQGTLIYTFPEARIHVLGCVATLQQKTTSAVDTTLNASVTGAIALGTATASATTLATTMVDLLPSTAFTSSATINVAGTAVNAALAAAAQFDGTTTAKAMYLNTAYATTGDVDADATQTISGKIQITYLVIGDYGMV